MKGIRLMLTEDGAGEEIGFSIEVGGECNAGEPCGTEAKIR